MITCLMPTYNRPSDSPQLLSDAVACFLAQDYDDAELLICNDTPGQTLSLAWEGCRCNSKRVRIINLPARFPTLSEKLAFMIEGARGDIFCRWDDDDLSLPWRLSLSLDRLGDGLEWHAENYWWNPVHDPEPMQHIEHPGNTHIMAIWRREILDHIGGYPMLDGARIGAEDQAFNKAIYEADVGGFGELLPPDQIYYIYRWGVSPRHMSGIGPTCWANIGEREIEAGEFVIAPIPFGYQKMVDAAAAAADRMAARA